MLEARYLSEEDIFNALGEFGLKVIETMGDENLTPKERAAWLAATVEDLTTELWEDTPRLGGMRPSMN